MTRERCCKREITLCKQTVDWSVDLSVDMQTLIAGEELTEEMGEAGGGKQNEKKDVFSSQAFFSLSFLEKLDLSWNQLTSLPVDFSASLSALRELRLEHNNLHYISGYRYLSVCPQFVMSSKPISLPPSYIIVLALSFVSVYCLPLLLSAWSIWTTWRS